MKDTPQELLELLDARFFEKALVRDQPPLVGHLVGLIADCARQKSKNRKIGFPKKKFAIVRQGH